MWVNTLSGEVIHTAWIASIEISEIEGTDQYGIFAEVELEDLSRLWYVLAHHEAPAYLIEQVARLKLHNTIEVSLPTITYH